MQLHHPVPLRVFLRHEGHVRELERGFLLCRGNGSIQPVLEDLLNLLFARRCIHDVVQRVVAQRASMGREKVQPGMQRLFQIRKGSDLHPCRLFQLRQILQVGPLLQIHGFVRTPGRKHRHFQGLVRRHLLMPFQAVHRIIRRADGLHIAHADQAPAGVSLARELFVSELPDFGSGLFIQNPLVSEEFPQLQMAPVMQGIADGLAQHLGIFLKFLVIRAVTGDILLRNAGAPHQPPLVVVTSQPYLGDVVIPDVFIDFPWIQMAVIIDDRAFLRHLMVEHPGRFRIQQKILVHERLHSVFPPFFLDFEIQAFLLAVCFLHLLNHIFPGLYRKKSYWLLRSFEYANQDHRFERWS